MNPMNTVLLISFLGLFGCNKGVQTASPNAAQTPRQASTFHALSALDIHGKTLSMQELKGRKVMVVNTASECGYTPQYEQLQELYEAYKDKGLVIIGFPCNQFGGQEPGTEQQIESFCQKNYGVTFPLMSKVEVKGDGQHPVYQWLASKEQNGVMDSSVKWNFHKYLVDENGNLVMSLESGVSPLDERVLAWLDGK
ncbi:MAG: glutathione peroxidase [Flavobacteriales bacterium]|nr:glutathione peroxidase [Flavobacteriales bacterium]